MKRITEKLMNDTPLILFFLLLTSSIFIFFGITNQAIAYGASSNLLEKELLISSKLELTQALSASNDNTTIRLSPGNYGSLRLSNLKFSNGIKIVSANPKNPAEFDSLEINNSRNIVVEGLSFRPQKIPSKGIYKYLIIVQNSDKISVSHNEVQGNESIDFDHFSGAFFRQVKSLSFFGNQLHGLERGAVFNNVDSANVEQNTVFNNTMDGFGFVAVTNLVIVGNFLHSTFPAKGNHPDFMQFWTTGANKSSENISILNNVMIQGKGGLSQCIFMRDKDGDFPYKNILIKNNLIYQEHFHGITVYYSDGLRIENNTVISPMDTQKELAIRVVSGSNVTIEKNISNKIVIKDVNNESIADNVIASPSGGRNALPYRSVFEKELDRYSFDIDDFQPFPEIGAGAQIDALKKYNILPKHENQR